MTSFGLSLANGDLINTQHLGSRVAGTANLFAPVLPLERLDRFPMQPILRGDILDRGTSTTPADVEGEALGMERTVRQPRQFLSLHGVAVFTGNATDIKLQINTRIAARQIAYAPTAAVVPAARNVPAGATFCFFERRVRTMTRAIGSPKTPLTVRPG